MNAPRIVYGVFDPKMTHVGVGETLRHNHLVGVRAAVLIEPRDVILANRLDNESFLIFKVAD